ncbi:MAG: GerAB/ArcD/ProY family transporter [Oscillospiraceae bacterium]|nr:GerAB/ArcD/ProY family transporter [Oscillospiraceae bacterium]
MSGKPATGTLHVPSGLAILLLFYLGGQNLFGTPTGLGADGWLAQILGLLFVVPLLLILARLVRILPGLNLFEMLECTLGRGLSVVISTLYFLYFLALAAMVRVYYGAFVQFVSLPNTPLLVILLAFFLLCAYLANSGTRAVGKWSLLLGAVLVFTTVVLTLLAVPIMRAEHLLPIGSSGGRALVQGGIWAAVNPLGGAVVLLALLERFDRTASPYKLFLFGTAVAVGMFVLHFLRDTAILGTGGMEALLYPFFKAVGAVQMGAIGVRVEFLAVLPVILAGLTKAAICLLAATKAARQVFRVPKGNRAMIPAALATVVLSAVLLPNLAALTLLPQIHLRVAPAFQVGFPVLLWLVAEGRGRRRPVVVKE